MSDDLAMLILIIFIFLLNIIPFFYYRNQIIFDLRELWGSIVLKYCNDFLHNYSIVLKYRNDFLHNYSIDRYNEMNRIYSYDTMYNCLPSHYKMLFMFWKTELRQFIDPIDLQLYDHIIKTNLENEKRKKHDV